MPGPWCPDKPMTTGMMGLGNKPGYLRRSECGQGGAVPGPGGKQAEGGGKGAAGRAKSSRKMDPHWRERGRDSGRRAGSDREGGNRKRKVTRQRRPKHS